MGYKIKYIAQMCDSETDQIIEEKEIKIKGLSFPKTFHEFGLRHKEQVELIKAAQDFLLEFQCNFFSEQPSCPQCGKKTKKHGKFKSDFHDVYTDHRVSVQRLACSCGWQSDHSIKSIYGNASHPELVKLQVKDSSELSFDKASKHLNDTCCGNRKVNNHATLIKNVNKVGICLEKIKYSEQWRVPDKSATQIILNVDGGHVQNREKGRHSFEELIATAYRPEDLVATSCKRKEISRKVSVASAKSDHQKNIKELTKNACLKLGMTKETKITALTDGANNCWPVPEYLSPYCFQVEKILDWFHIGKKFQERKSKIPAEFIKKYDGAKWYLWHGKPQDSLNQLQEIKQRLSDDVSLEKVDELITYVTNNIKHIVNYQERQENQLPFTSQLAETSVNSVINDRQKNKKMQWTREGAHNILQIRTSIFSKNFDAEWKEVEGDLYKSAA